MQFNISFLGEGGVGKTAWIYKMKTEIFDKKYVATVGHEVHPYAVNTNHGQILLSFFDYAGQEMYGGSRIPMKPIDATILMFDFTREYTYKKLASWRLEKCAADPMFVVGNKADLERKVQNPTFHTEHGLPYLELSAKTMAAADLLTPILRRLTGHEDLVIVEDPVIME
jgi:GTP-binding nuclear protein Ran